MIITLLLFWVLVIWGLYDGSLDGAAARNYIILWLLAGASMFVFTNGIYMFIVVSTLLAIMLIVKVMGGDVTIR